VITEIKALIQRNRQILQQAFFEGVKPIFEKYKLLQDFSWVQFTPYWCDGSECTFGVNDDVCVNTNGFDYEEAYNDDIPFLTEKEVKSIRTELVDIIRKIGADDLKELFGDHAEVLVTREGVTVRKWEHE
jgi:hypothetical protein